MPQVKGWNGTIQILADGSVDPSTAPINHNGNIYTLTGNIISSGDGIVIEINSVTVDGNGYVIQGSSSGNGIDLTSTSDVTVENFTIESFSFGIFAPFVNYDTITGNNIAQNSATGIWLESSSNNNVYSNNIEENGAFGIWLGSSQNNNVYHNNFVNNAAQVCTTYDSNNIWDQGYPAGGNYWSDYTGKDQYNGPGQDQPGSDGIGDTPYTKIDQNNIDHYPLMIPYNGFHDAAVTNITPSKTVIGTGFMVVGTPFSDNVTVLVADNGDYAESFNVTVYANFTVIGIEQVSLNAADLTTLTFGWNTTTGLAYGNYTLSAYAWPVPGETNTADNNFTGGAVTVTIPGDINGDFKVSLADLVLLANAYGTTPASGGNPEVSHAWNPNADIDGNGVVGLSDLVILATHY